MFARSQLNWRAPSLSPGTWNKFVLHLFGIISCQLLHPSLFPTCPSFWSLVDMKMQMEDQKLSKRSELGEEGLWFMTIYRRCDSHLPETPCRLWCATGLSDISLELGRLSPPKLSLTTCLWTQSAFSGLIIVVICAMGKGKVKSVHWKRKRKIKRVWACWLFNKCSIILYILPQVKKQKNEDFFF